MSYRNFSKSAQTVIEAEGAAAGFFHETDVEKKRGFEIMASNQTSKVWISAYRKKLAFLRDLCPSKEGIKTDDWAIISEFMRKQANKGA